jgi:hypothetical protein
MARPKAWNVTTEPAGKKPSLPVREGEKRSAVRHYHLRAKTNAAARSQIEDEEHRLEEQTGAAAWKVTSVKAA